MNADIRTDRLRCPHAAYVVTVDPLLLECRCIICARCHEHTGNGTQGHYWGLCRVTHTTREHHFCCPDNCELETPA